MESEIQLVITLLVRWKQFCGKYTFIRFDPILGLILTLIVYGSQASEKQHTNNNEEEDEGETWKSGAEEEGQEDTVDEHEEKKTSLPEKSPEKIEEIARMLSGENISPQAIEVAKNLLSEQ